MADISSILEEAALRYRGSGGVIAVVKDGKLAGQRAWGFADISARIPMTSSTILPICSITKQMTCAVIHDLQRNPTAGMSSDVPVSQQLEENLHELLGRDFCKSNNLTMKILGDNRSGIRDYWALNTLLGAQVDDLFSLETHARPMVNLINKSLHFTPGSEYSYSNTNYHILARVAERTSGHSLGKLLSERIFGPAKMTTASLCPPSDHQPGPCVGYEIDEKHGFFPATNRIEWSGDAGIVASLDDMIAYEIYLQELWNDPNSWYRQHSDPGKFTDGTPSKYANGLAFSDIDGITTIGHGGALRGYRLFRSHAPSKGVSVVVLFNHEADSGEASTFVMRKVLGLLAPSVASLGTQPAQEWVGHFLDRDTNLAVSGTVTDKDTIAIGYARKAEPVRLTSSTEAASQGMKAEIKGDALSVHRLADNRLLEATRLNSSDASRRDPLLPGQYYCGELDSVFTCSGQGEVLYGAFDGPLGHGPATAMNYFGGDVWLLACPRGQDAQPPGDWTLVFHRDDSNGSIRGVTIGCWLARKLEFVKRA